MKSKNALAISLIMAVATTVVIIYSFVFPSYANIILSVYTITVILLWLFVAISSTVYDKCKTTIDTADIADISENLNTEIVIWMNDFSAVYMNKRLRDLLGITQLDFDNVEILKKIFEIDDMNDENLNQIINGEKAESTFIGASGKKYCIAWSTSLFKQNKNYSLYFSTGFNLTEIKEMQGDLRKANEYFNLSLELSEIGMIVSQDGKNLYISPEMARMLGADTQDFTVKNFKKRVHPNDRLIYESCIKKLYSNNNNSDVQSLEIRLKTDSGNYHWYSYRIKAIHNANDSIPILGGALIDVTKEKEKDLLIERIAYVDEVTGIANRTKLVKTGQETLDNSELLGYSYWIIVLDFDRFHIVNDSCGYENGNILLKNFAHTLYKYVGVGGLAARISGDNFALIVRDYNDPEIPIQTIKAIQKDLNKLAVDEFATINLTCSAGYSKMPEHGKTFIEMLEHAEFALKSGEDCSSSINAYDPSMHDSIISKTELEKSLVDAIDKNELHLFYQPKINLTTGKIIGVEALVRWIKPDGSIVGPDQFVPIAETSHLISRISDFVLNEACRQNMMWQRMGYPPIVVSINFTSADFYQSNIKEKVFEVLAKTGLEAKWLEVELTETLALRDVDYAISQMNSLRDLGVKLAMDDFGTGYSSLSYIQLLPITLLKLDKSFIEDIETDNIALEIVSSVIRIAKSKKIETIAEGIEKIQQARILKEAGCDHAQGYLYGKPMPPQEIQEFFETNPVDPLV